MAYIYKITNLVNGKIYVGKTIYTIERRFKEHLSDSKRGKYENRPLYKAINKYGKDNFIIEAIEKCEDDKASEREIYWIEKLNSYHNGYNATLGGDGKNYLDYEFICQTYQQVQNAVKTAQICNCCPDTVLEILKKENIPVLSSSEIAKRQQGKKVIQLSLDGKEIQRFPTLRDAGRYLVETHQAKGGVQGIGSNIRQVCENRRKTAYKYKWIWDLD